MRDLTHRILFLAGTTLLAAAVIYGAPSPPAWDRGPAGAPVRVASAADFQVVIAPLRMTIKRKSMRHTDTVKPNGASCPGADTPSAIPPGSNESGQAGVQTSPAPPPMPNGKVASPCPPNGSDARADIARGHALATPEPLNSKQLIAPAAKTPG